MASAQSVRAAPGVPGQPGFFKGAGFLRTTALPACEAGALGTGDVAAPRLAAVMFDAMDRRGWALAAEEGIAFGRQGSVAIYKQREHGLAQGRGFQAVWLCRFEQRPGRQARTTEAVVGRHPHGVDRV